MAIDSSLKDMENRIRALPVDQQLWLVERLVKQIRLGQRPTRPDLSQEIALMAADPEIQREIREIEKQFAATESLDECRRRITH
jgi:hypothetical protein